ncbi:VirB4 family type IV secretion system protein, partial [[Mycoplasma] testudinis]|uniref:VirB4 family type IV secretion system protein n=1 Tax=[Mycoplasma] testudinis TaxID=33924 RepID=UPI00055EEADF
ENVELIPADQYSKKFILQKVFFHSLRIVDVHFTYMTQTSLNNEKEYVSFLKISALPNFVNIDWLADIFKRSGFDIAVECLDIPAVESRRMIDLALTNFSSEARSKQNHRTSAVDETILEFQQFALDELKNDFAINQETIKNVSFIFRVYAPTMKELKEAKDFLKNFMWQQKIIPNTLLGNQWKALKSWLPVYDKTQGTKRYKRKLIKSNFNLASGTLAFGMPFSINKVIEEKGDIVGIDENAYPVALNFLETTDKVTNRNIVTIGQPGSGKTTLNCQIIYNAIVFGKSKVIIIDPSNEYGSNDPLLGKNLLDHFPFGVVIDVTDTKHFRINPFAVWPNQPIKAKVDFINNFFNIIFDQMLSKQQIQVLVNICFDFYKEDFEREFSFSEILAKFQTLPDKDNIIVFSLKQYCQGGVYGDYWDVKTKFDFNSDLIIFNINQLRDMSKIFESQMYIIMNYLLYAIYQNPIHNKNLFLVLDEEHKLINSEYPFILNTVVELNKQARKFKGAVLNSTQNVKDFVKSSALKENAVNIVNNCATMFCMKMNENDLKGLDEILSEVRPLTDSEKYVLRSQDRGQALMFRGNDKVFLNVEKII